MLRLKFNGYSWTEPPDQHLDSVAYFFVFNNSKRLCGSAVHSRIKSDCKCSHEEKRLRGVGTTARRMRRSRVAAFGICACVPAECQSMPCAALAGVASPNQFRVILAACALRFLGFYLTESAQSSADISAELVCVLPSHFAAAGVESTLIALAAYVGASPQVGIGPAEFIAIRG